MRAGRRPLDAGETLFSMNRFHRTATKLVLNERKKNQCLGSLADGRPTPASRRYNSWGTVLLDSMRRLEAMASNGLHQRCRKNSLTQ